MSLHVGGNAVTGAQRIRGESDNSNRSGTPEKVGNGIGLWRRHQGSSRVYFLLASSIFCLSILSARLRIVSVPSLCGERLQFPDRQIEVASNAVRLAAQELIAQRPIVPNRALASAVEP